MNAKGFVLMIIALLILMGASGGSFVGGLLLGRSQEGTDEGSLAAMTPSAPGQASEDQSNGSSFAQIQQQIQSGELSQDQIAQFRQQFQGQFGQRGGNSSSGGFAGGDALVGTLEGVEGDTISVNTPQGTLKATIGGETIIQQTAQISLEDLTQGMRLTVVGGRADDGTVEARTVIVIPEGSEGIGGGGFGGRSGNWFGGQHGGTQSRDGS